MKGFGLCVPLESVNARVKLLRRQVLAPYLLRFPHVPQEELESLAQFPVEGKAAVMYPAVHNLYR